MRLTQYSDYALRVLIHAALKDGAFCTVNEIATAYGISRNHLMKVVQGLARLGYVETARGKNGGLRLAQAAESIRLGKLIRETEGDFALVECMGPANGCPIHTCCAAPSMLDEALSAFISVLDRYTLADVVQREAPLRAALGIRADS